MELAGTQLASQGFVQIGYLLPPPTSQNEIAKQRNVVCIELYCSPGLILAVPEAEFLNVNWDKILNSKKWFETGS